MKHMLPHIYINDLPSLPKWQYVEIQRKWESTSWGVELMLWWMNSPVMKNWQPSGEKKSAAPVITKWQPGDWKKWQPGDKKKNQQPGDIKYGSPVIKIMAPFPHALKALSFSIPSNRPSHSEKKKLLLDFFKTALLSLKITASPFKNMDWSLLFSLKITASPFKTRTDHSYSLWKSQPHPSKHGLITPIHSENHSLTPPPLLFFSPNLLYYSLLKKTSHLPFSIERSVSSQNQRNTF